jgi:flagellar basal-body rod modification protein FlgD
MSVAAVGSTQPIQTTPPASSTQSAVGDLDANAFLKMLITQLQNQDPTQPMDSTAFVAQLASFSEVEQTTTSNAKLDSLLNASGLSLANAVIGRTVTSADGSTSGIVAAVKLTADGPVATLTDGSTVSLGSGVEVS